METPAYVKTHVFLSCLIGLAVYGVARWFGFPMWGILPSDFIVAGGLFYVLKELATTGLVMRDGSWKKDWTYPMIVTAALSFAGRMYYWFVL